MMRGRLVLLIGMAGGLVAPAAVVQAVGEGEATSEQSSTLGELPVVAWQQTTLTLREGGSVQTVQIVAWRTVDGVRVDQGELVVPYRLGGTATLGADYRLDPLETIRFIDGRASAPLRITVIDDDEPEPTEAIEITLQDGDAYVVDGQYRTLVVSIIDNDEAAEPETPSDPAGQPPAALPSDNPAPVLSSLSPASAPGHPAFILTVRGSGFLRGSVIHWGDRPLPTRFVSDTELRAQITPPHLDLVRGGEIEVRVVNPPPGGGASEAVPFRVEGVTRPGRSG